MLVSRRERNKREQSVIEQKQRAGMRSPHLSLLPTLPCSEDYFLFLEICISRIQIATQLASWKGHISHQQQLVEERRG